MVFLSGCRQALMMALMFKALQLAVGHGRVRMDDIDAALRNGETNFNRNGVGNGILSMPQLTHDDHVLVVLGAEYPQFVQPNEEIDRFMSQSLQASEVPGPRSIHEIISWLEEKPCFIEQVLLNQRRISALEIQSTSKILLKLADELVVLRPDNISNRSYDIHMRQWRVYWNDLLSEMKTVATRTTCSGAFVLTNWPYPEFLTTLAQTLCEKIA